MQTESTETDNEESKSSRELDQNIITFEQRKIEDIKQIMLDFTLIQLKQHVKSMEILSATYQDIVAIDVDKDVDAFKSKFLLHSENKSLQQQVRAQSMNALTSIFASSKGGKRQNLSNSSASLESVKRVPAHSNGKLSPGRSIESEKVDSDTDESSATESDDDVADETTSHDESDSDREIVGVRRRFSPTVATEYDEDEDDVEEKRNSNLKGRTSSSFAKTQGKQDSMKKPPVPQVRLSKIAQYHPKPT